MQLCYILRDGEKGAKGFFPKPTSRHSYALNYLLGPEKQGMNISLCSFVYFFTEIHPAYYKYNYIIAFQESSLIVHIFKWLLYHTLLYISKLLIPLLIDRYLF